MLIVFSICSTIYAIFYVVITFSNINISYVENIISLNIQKIKEYTPSLDNGESDGRQKGYHIENVRGG